MSLKQSDLKGDRRENSTTKTRNGASEESESNHTLRAAVLGVEGMLGLFVGSPLPPALPFSAAWTRIDSQLSSPLPAKDSCPREIRYASASERSAAFGGAGRSVQAPCPPHTTTSNQTYPHTHPLTRLGLSPGGLLPAAGLTRVFISSALPRLYVRRRGTGSRDDIFRLREHQQAAMAGLNYVTFNQDHSLLAVGTRHRIHCRDHREY